MIKNFAPSPAYPIPSSLTNHHFRSAIGLPKRGGLIRSFTGRRGGFRVSLCGRRGGFRVSLTRLSDGGHLVPCCLPPVRCRRRFLMPADPLDTPPAVAWISVNRPHTVTFGGNITGVVGSLCWGFFLYREIVQVVLLLEPLQFLLALWCALWGQSL